MTSKDRFNKFKKWVSSLNLDKKEVILIMIDPQDFLQTISSKCPENQAKPGSKSVKSKSKHSKSQSNPTLYPDINAGRWCTVCPNKSAHLIANCPNLEWHERWDPIPPGANDNCPRNQYCFARSSDRGYCNGYSHFSYHCPQFQYRVKPQQSPSQELLSEAPIEPVNTDNVQAGLADVLSANLATGSNELGE